MLVVDPPFQCTSTMPAMLTERRKKARALKHYSDEDLWQLLSNGQPIPAKNKSGFYGVSRYTFPNTGFEGFQGVIIERQWSPNPDPGLRTWTHPSLSSNFYLYAINPNP